MKKIFLTMMLAVSISGVFSQDTIYVKQQSSAPPPQQQSRSGFAAFTPHARINLYGSYVFDDDFESYYSDYDYYYGTIEGGFLGGVGLEYMTNPFVGIELQYVAQSTNAPTYYRRDVGISTAYENFVVGIDYIMLGVHKYLGNAKGNVEGYGGIQAGMAIVGIDSPSRGASGSVNKFAWGMNLGCNLWATQRIGIKLQAHLLSIVDGMGGGLYFGTGGAGVGVSTYSTFYQFGLGGGLAFKLGK